MPASEIIFFGSLTSANTILAALNRSSTVKLSAFFYNRKLVIVIYNAQKYYSFNKKDINTNYHPGLAWYPIWNFLHLWSLY